MTHDLPPFHVCQSLTAENENIKQKYDKLKRKYKQLYKDFLDLKEQLITKDIEAEYKHLRNIPSNQGRLKPTKTKSVGESKMKQTEEGSSIKKLVPLYDNLLKRYENENKQNRIQLKRINKLEAENEKMKENMFKLEQEKDFLNKQVKDKDILLRTASSANKNKRSSNQTLENRIDELMKEKKSLVHENGKLKDELKGLDESFFEELEDMKYALQQSAKLNKEYEKALKRICKQTGMNYKRTLQENIKHSTPNS